MRKRYLAMMAAAVIASVLAMAPATGSVGGAQVQGTSASEDSMDDSDRAHWKCQQEFAAAVHEDNEAYNAHDIERYTAILHPDLVMMANGDITVGREAHLEQARELMETPGWTWEHEIKSVTMHGCKTGVAVVDFWWKYPPKDTEIHYSGTMTLVRENGIWLVAQDNIYELSRS